ncbi:hypothetical protein AWC38_SpisGene16723 [Stylophora pistillata]|uniref:CxC3 like cysteine cluster domain-containing protein n=1 Tax=Stylophora pistillata TaxID=50429 RepID=A0A2B4RMP5_STYPI|nr:hypothetical protein AWC38_SpisGene16723 [Stylophora pistillata]
MRRLKPVFLDVKNIRRDGKKTTVSIPLRVDLGKQPHKSTEENSQDTNSPVEQDVPLEDVDKQELSTQQQNRVLSISANWEKVREKLLNSYIEEQHLPDNTNCVNRQKSIATTRCEYCGPRQYFCVECARALHVNRNKSHVLEQGRMGYFLLWSPENPSTGFSFKLMEFVEKVFLHCQVSLLNITEVITKLNPQLQPTHVSSIYSILNSECLKEFRYFMHQYKHCTNYKGNLYNGAWYPICPRDDGVLIESMDGCFGLCRKMEEGHDLGTPKHGTLLFADQDDVDNFVNSYGKAGADMEQNCSKFHAGEVLSAFRSKGKNKLFDKKGVFGISYSVYELKRLRSLNESTRSRVIIIVHLRKASWKVLMLPYPYSIAMGTRHHVRFSSVTKEMSAHKRTDVLTDGLLHYAQHLYHKFGVTLNAKFARAETLLHDVSAKLEELTEKLPGCDDDMIQQWQKDEVEALKPKEHELTLQWYESYVSLLHMSKKLRNELSYVQDKDEGKVKDVEKKIERCQEELELLKEEINRLVSFLQNESRLIDESVEALLPLTDNPLNAGMITCLKKKRMIHCNHISSLLHLWGGILDFPKPIDHAEVAKSYAHLSGIDYLPDDEKSDESMMEEDVDDEAFVLELSSDSELSDDE